MRFVGRLPFRAPLFALLLLAACDRDPAQLVEEINAAREGCTEEDLRAGNEQCVQMMERYAEMGTEAIATYIGAVKTLDQALRRMPQAQFDTSGVGHALSPEFSGQAWEDTSPSTVRSYSPTWNRSPRPEFRGTESWASPVHPQDQWEEPLDGYDEDPRYDRPYPVDPYRYERSYEPGYRGERGYGYPSREHGGAYVQPRPGARYGAPYDPRYGSGQPGYPERYDQRGRAIDPRVPPPARGQLLPPEQRLRRPWLSDERVRDPRSQWGPRGEWPEFAPEWEEDRRWPQRDPLPPLRR